jgi:3-methyl-2-oxobutanoate hydroxymethyltransferase
VHVLLLGDSAAQVILGHDSTVHMPFELTVELTAALKRGAPTCHVMADMPFGSYGVTEAESIRNAMTLMTRGRADSVKIEVGSASAGLVEKMTTAGVPVCAHVGLRPSHVGLVGSYRAAGRDAESAKRVVDDAVSLAEAGAVLLLVEAVPPEVTRAIVDRTSVPVIGIGAGSEAHGQILVTHDLVGLSEKPPRFAARAAETGEMLLEAGRAWVDRVASREIGGSGYSMPADERERFLSIMTLK